MDKAHYRPDEIGDDGLPMHIPMGLTADGHGPVEPGEPGFDHMGCWCGQEHHDQGDRSDRG